MKQTLLVIVLLSFSFATLAQTLPAPDFIGETKWGCGSFSAKKRWTKISGAESYEVKIDNGPWMNVGNVSSYKYPLSRERVTRLYVRAVANGERSPSSRVSVRQSALSYYCDTDDSSRAQGGAGSGGGDADDVNAMGGYAGQNDKPLIQTCLDLPERFVVSGTVHGTQCQLVTTAGIGFASLIAQGFLEAIDVWGIVEGAVQVCFQNQGTLKFLDAATAPRAISDLPAQTVDGMTCATIERAGTVALMRASGQAPNDTETIMETEATVAT